MTISVRVITRIRMNAVGSCGGLCTCFASVRTRGRDSLAQRTACNSTRIDNDVQEPQYSASYARPRIQFDVTHGLHFNSRRRHKGPWYCTRLHVYAPYAKSRTPVGLVKSICGQSSYQSASPAEHPLLVMSTATGTTNCTDEDWRSSLRRSETISMP
ncbi:hypothetical protein PENSPDRAFT_396157 [Peniophora sp. CONT]|nr:hypothetical protein PENSPDRAFT_396157 [Peniophora sp. CONT]